jgi:putative ABC transport system permease protein
MRLATFAELHVGESAKALWMLMGVVTLVLLIPCANVANLFLARTTRRRGEVALRAALGASPGRLVRLVLTEGGLVALAAGSLGLLMARWGVRFLIAFAPTELPRMETIGIDWRVVLFTYGAALGTSLFFGAMAAAPATRPRLSEILKESGRGASDRGHARQGFIVAQSAISMMLLTGAGLLVVTFVGLAHVDPGFDPDELVAVRFPVKPSAYESSQDLWALQRRVREELRGSLAIASIAAATNLPFERVVPPSACTASSPIPYDCGLPRSESVSPWERGAMTSNGWC